MPYHHKEKDKRTCCNFNFDAHSFKMKQIWNKTSNGKPYYKKKKLKQNYIIAVWLLQPRPTSPNFGINKRITFRQVTDLSKQASNKLHNQYNCNKNVFLTVKNVMFFEVVVPLKERKQTFWMNITWLKIPTGRRQTSWLYTKCDRGFEFRTT